MINNNGQHTDHHTHHPSQQRPPHPPPKPLISKPKPPIRNPRRQFETHRSKLIQKKIITEATIGATDDQPNRSTHQSTDPPFQTHHQSILAYNPLQPQPNHDPNTRPKPWPMTQTPDPTTTHNLLSTGHSKKKKKNPTTEPVGL